jgi:hypothetical protein
MVQTSVSFWEAGTSTSELITVGKLIDTAPVSCGFRTQNLKGERRVVFTVVNKEGIKKQVFCSTPLSEVVRAGIITHGEASIKNTLLNSVVGLNEKNQYWFTGDTLVLTSIADALKAKSLTIEELYASAGV